MEKIPIQKDQIQEESTTNTKGLKFNFLIANILGVLFWTYVPIKLFIFDIDQVLLKKISPHLIWISDYRLLLVLGVICLAISMIPATYLYILFILFFPLILLFAYIPYVLYKAKSWPLFFALLNTVLSFFRYFKYTFIATSVFLVAAVIAVKSSNQILISSSLFILVIFGLVTLGRTIYLSFKPSQVFQIQRKIINWIRTSTFGKSLIEKNGEIKDKPFENLKDNELTLFTTSLQMAVIMNRGCYFLAHKIEEYKDGKIGLILNALSYVGLYVKLIVILSVVNFDLFRLSASNFTFQHLPSYLHFLYYSFYSITPGSFGGIDQLLPSSDIALILRMTMGILGYVLLPIVLINIVVSLKSERDSRAIELTIVEIRNEGAELEKFIESEYSLNIVDAISKLNELQSSFIKFVYTLSGQIPNINDGAKNK